MSRKFCHVVYKIRVLYYKSYKDFHKKHFKNNSNATKEKWEVEDGAGVY